MSQNEECILTWNIENFSFCDKTFAEYIESPTFNVKYLPLTDWWFRLYPRGSDDTSKDVLCLELVISKMSTFELPINCRIELCNAKNEVFVSVEKKYFNFINGINNLIDNSIKLLERDFRDLEKKVNDSGNDTLIVRCWMPMSKNDETGTPVILKCTAKTEITFDTFSFLWKLYVDRSPDWSEVNEVTMSKYIHFRINLKSSQNDILVEIEQVGETKASLLRVKCKIACVKDGDEIFSNWNSFSFDKSSSKWIFPSFLKKSLLFEKKENFALICLKFNFLISNRISLSKLYDETKNQLPTSAVSSSIPTNNYLKDGLRLMLFSKDFSDVSFRIENEIVKAHKIILASMSPVFKAMFQQNMLETETGVIDITDMDVQTLKLFLEFLYTGDIEYLNWESSVDLLCAAEKYQVSSLKEKSSEYLRNSFSADNVCDVLSVADMVWDQTLKTAAIDYIKENSTEVLDSPMWKNWIKKNVDLSSEIIYFLSQELKSIQKRR